MTDHLYFNSALKWKFWYELFFFDWQRDLDVYLRKTLKDILLNDNEETILMSMDETQSFTSSKKNAQLLSEISEDSRKSLELVFLGDEAIFDFAQTYDDKKPEWMKASNFLITDKVFIVERSDKALNWMACIYYVYNPEKLAIVERYKQVHAEMYHTT